MKSTFKSFRILYVLLLVFSVTIASAQNFNLSNNARKVISIYEDKFASGQIKLISDPTTPFVERVSFIDNRSNIVIYIDRDSLAKFKDFIGSISLTARINNRLIEVNPYSEVGKELKTVGVNGVNSTRDFASSLVSFIAETSKFNQELFCDFFDRYTLLIDNRQIETMKYRLQNVLNQIDLFYSVKNRPTRNVDLMRYIRNNYIDLFDSFYIPENADSIEVLLEINNIKREYTRRLEDYKSDEIDKETISDLFKIQTNLKLIKSYIDYLSNSNIETSRAYSKSIERDPIFVSHISQTFSNAIAKYNSVLSDLTKSKEWKISKINDVTMRSALEDIQYVILQVESLRDVILLPELNTLYETWKNKLSPEELKSENPPKIVRGYDGCSTSQRTDFEHYYSKPTVRKEYIERLAVRASNYIYNKLEPATIDLRKEDAKEGDILRIYVTRYNSEGEQSPSDSSKTHENKKEILVAAFDIKELGFRVKVADSFLLVKRNKKDETDVDDSPSRWKGAPGVSLMWSYGSDGGRNKFWKWCEPSFGLNVSYVDFAQSKDIEVGVGLVAGIFRNKVFFVAGTNLNVKEKPGYFGLGFSFTNLASKFTDAKNNSN